MQQSNTLVQTYNKLDPIYKRIMQVIALLYQVPGSSFYASERIGAYGSKVQQNLLLHLANEFDIGQKSLVAGKNTNQQINVKQFEQYLNFLKKAGLLDKNCQCSAEVCHFIIQDALSSENIAITLPLISSGKEFSPFPSLDNYYDRGNYNPSGIGSNDLRILNIVIHSNKLQIFTQKTWYSELQQKIIAAFRMLLNDLSLDEEWVRGREPIFQYIICVNKLGSDLGYDLPELPPDRRNYWCNLLASLPLNIKWYDFNLLPLLINQLNIVYANYEIIELNSYNTLNQWAQNFNQGRKLLQEGAYDAALKCFDSSIKEFSQLAPREHWFLLGETTILYMVALLKKDKLDKIHSTILKRLDKVKYLNRLASLLASIYQLRHNNIAYAKQVCERLQYFYSKAVNITNQIVLEYALFSLVTWYVAKVQTNWEGIRHYYKVCDEFSNSLAKTILAQLLIKRSSVDEDAKAVIASSPYGQIDFTSLIVMKAEWEYTFDQLSSVLGNSVATEVESKATNSHRLVWFIDPIKGKVEVREQQILKSGNWGVGKKIALSRLINRENLDFLLPEDNLAIAALKPHQWYYNSYDWNIPQLLLSLIGHPNVFDINNLDIRVELIQDYPELQVKSNKNGYTIKLLPVVKEEGLKVTKLGSGKYQLVDFSGNMFNLLQVIKDGVTFPKEAKERLLQLVCRNYPQIKVNTDIVDDNLPIIAAHSTCYVQLLPLIEGGLQVSVMVKPFADNGGYYFPTQGAASIISTNEQKLPIKLERNFKEEQVQYQQLLSSCPILETSQQSKYEWVYETQEEALQLLSELHLYRKENSIIIEWPKGESLKVKASLTVRDLKIKIKSQQQWFEYDGEVSINENEVLNLKVLLGLLDVDANSRFIQLDDGKFLALSESFRKQLAELKLLSEGNKVSSFGSDVLGELIDAAGEAKVDKKWQEHLDKLSMRSKFTPELPNTLQAELRDYQLEGFNYLARLANWEIGACLADDMGLGKTVQAIAILLEQAKNGPSLVIAPTSVCYNWLSEINKFAPSLNPFLLHDEDKRDSRIKELSASDVLVCSYNLLQYENEAIAAKEWNLIVLDEAQNIKNHTTKRFKTACALNTKRKIALSGTPIENHLGELWSIFRFLNPGLLGSIDSFQKKFVNPISNKNQLVKQTLKNLIQPYILRRTKTQVLSELPPKIEQSIYIEPSNEELAFYEAVRQKAMENISKMGELDNKRFSILAEITRLRQACCHSSLVDESINLENSKLAAFLELVNDLLANNHKVLVFSQYVRYLDIVKGTLQENSIDFHYIDGSTPINQRKSSVSDFQNGVGGSVFLISLKAGGTGLNLTAADFVIILDPWWNPAVEDQAADRAHRMGQQRPVTVYRLIMKNTIEEKIINLHKDKRDLAGDLLSGQDVGGKLSEKDLLNLMQI